MKGALVKIILVPSMPIAVTLFLDSKSFFILVSMWHFQKEIDLLNTWNGLKRNSIDKFILNLVLKFVNSIAITINNLIPGHRRLYLPLCCCYIFFYLFIFCYNQQFCYCKHPFLNFFNDFSGRCFKVGLSPSKRISFHLHQWKPFKNGDNCFLFHLESSFDFQDI